MGYRESVDDRLKSPENILEDGTVIQHMKLNNGGRRPGDTTTPDWLKVLIVDSVIQEKAVGNPAPITTVAKAFDVSVDVPRQLVNRPHETKDPKVRRAISKRIASSRSQAVNTLKFALSLIPSRIEATVDKLPAKDLAQIAKDMASIVEKTAPPEEHAAKNQVVFYTPRMRSEQEFEVIEVPAVPVE